MMGETPNIYVGRAYKNVGLVAGGKGPKQAVG